MNYETRQSSDTKGSEHYDVTLSTKEGLFLIALILAVSMSGMYFS